MSRVGKRIQEERIKKGLSPKQLGKKCGVAESFILDIESGSKIINEKVLAQISKVLGTNLEESMSMTEAIKEEKVQKTIQKKPQNFTAKSSGGRSEVQPLPMWEDALSNIIKKIPIYDIEMTSIKGYKSFPIIDKKVEGFNPDKLIYIQLADDILTQFRIKKGDRCLISLNHELKNNSFNLIEYNKKKYLRKVRKVDGNKLQLMSGTSEDKVVVKDIKEIKVLGRLIRVEIDF